MKDFAGSEIKVGDIVSYSEHGHPQLHLGRVVRLTKQRACLVKIDKMVESATYQRAKREHLKNPDQVTLLSNTMRHLDDIEVWYAFQRERGLA